jgi:hypothetical protein
MIQDVIDVDDLHYSKQYYFPIMMSTEIASLLFSSPRFAFMNPLVSFRGKLALQIDRQFQALLITLVTFIITVVIKAAVPCGTAAYSGSPVIATSPIPLLMVYFAEVACLRLRRLNVRRGTEGEVPASKQSPITP